MISIFIKELGQYLHSLIAYIVISVFLISLGLLMWVFPETSVLEYGYADMETLFTLGPYILMFIIPAITMRTFSEEYKSGTIELLFTRPYGDVKIITGKYLGSLVVVGLALLPTIVYYLSLYNLGSPVGNLDTPGIVGSYIGLFLLCAVFTSIGVLCSSFTENQIIAFIVGVFICFLSYTGFRSLAGIDTWQSMALYIDQLGILYHYESISKGLVDSRNVVYFLSFILLMLLTTWFLMSKRKW